MSAAFSSRSHIAHCTSISFSNAPCSISRHDSLYASHSYGAGSSYTGSDPVRSSTFYITFKAVQLISLTCRPKIQLSFLETREERLPLTPYLTPQCDSVDSVASSLTLHADIEQLDREVQRILGVKDGEVVYRHPLDPPDYTLEDLPNTKANNILYHEFANRTEKILLQLDVDDHLRRTRQRIKWAEMGGGGTCSQQLIDHLSHRIWFLEECLDARKALMEGKYAAEVLKSNHADLVLLERNIGRFWARPRRVGREWRYLSKQVIEELIDKDERDVLDGLEEFLVVNDLLYAIVSATGLCNFLGFGSSGVSGEREGWVEERVMGGFISHDGKMVDGKDILYDDIKIQSTRKHTTINPSWIYNPSSVKTRSSIVTAFISSTLPTAANSEKTQNTQTSWSSNICNINLAIEEEPKPLSFKEKTHLAQRAFTLQNHLRCLLGRNAVLGDGDAGLDVREYATLGPSGVGVGFSGVGRGGGGFVFSSPVDSRVFEEINHRGEEFDVLREEFKHAIQCWWYLWQKYGKEVRKYLFERQAVEVREVAGNGDGEKVVVQVVEPTLDDDEITTLEETTLDRFIFEGRESVELSSDNQQPSAGKNDMHFQITSLTTAEIIHDSGEVESFSIEEEEGIEEEGDILMHVFMSSPPSHENFGTSYSSPPSPITIKSPSLKHRIEEIEAPNPKRRRISYLRKYNIHPSHLDGTSRVCPETGETWWADAPPYFMFGETPTMAEIVSDQMKEDLRKGLLFLYV